MPIDWYSSIYNSLIVAGVIIILCTIGTPSKSSLTGTIVGYSFIMTGVLLLVGYLMTNLQSTTSILSKIITVGPFVVLIGILIYMVYLLSIYFNQITSLNISQSYYNFMNIFIVLLMILLYVFYYGSRDQGFQKSGALNKVTGLFLYLIETVNIIVVITLAIILKYFSTDG
jgi:hypothetical protein